VSKEKHIPLNLLIFALALLTIGGALLTTGALGPERAFADRGADCTEIATAPGKVTLTHLRSAVLCLVNRARRRHGIEPLRENSDLRLSASAHSNDMVAKDYFSHNGPNGSTPTRRLAKWGYLTRVDAYVIGENIGGGSGRRFGSPLGVFRAWMHSPPHRANILDREFRNFGVGVARGFPGLRSAEAATYTLDLGRRVG